MVAQKLFKLLALVVSLVLLSPQSAEAARQDPPELLTYDELVELYNQDVPPEPLRGKLVRLLTTPFLSNEASARSVAPIKPELPHLGKSLRVVFWNIERGLQFEAIVAAFTDPAKFASLIDETRYPTGSEARERILKQVDMMRQADVIALNEVDWGMKRTGYRNVIAELASALDMNYAYGVEFVYPGPAVLKVEEIEEEIIEDPDEPVDMTPVDPARYRGLHGNAILSRYPLENARIVSLGTFEGGARRDDKKRRTEEDETLYLIERVRQSKRGGRMAVLADILDPDIPGGRVTIISTHLDASTKPRNRRRQMQILLSEIKEIGNPVILAGDMNTAAMDTTPASAWRLVKRRAKSKRFWLTRGVAYITGVGFMLDAFFVTLRYSRTQADPTVSHIPLIAPNPEAKFFSTLKKHRFDAGAAFDFRGDRERSAGSSGTLSNSNERGGKGFTTTFELSRTVLGVGKFKLDWIFVRPPALTGPRDKKQSYRFAPHFGRTLKELNYSVRGRISDHDPLVVDLPFDEPQPR